MASSSACGAVRIPELSEDVLLALSPDGRTGRLPVAWRRGIMHTRHEHGVHGYDVPSERHVSGSQSEIRIYPNYHPSARICYFL